MAAFYAMPRGQSQSVFLTTRLCGAALRETSAPVAFLLNETDDLAQIEQGIELGFNAVMVEGDFLRTGRLPAAS